MNCYVDLYMYIFLVLSQLSRTSRIICNNSKVACFLLFFHFNGNVFDVSSSFFYSAKTFEYFLYTQKCPRLLGYISVQYRQRALRF